MMIGEALAELSDMAGSMAGRLQGGLIIAEPGTFLTNRQDFPCQLP